MTEEGTQQLPKPFQGCSMPRLGERRNEERKNRAVCLRFNHLTATPTFAFLLGSITEQV